jgi:hypothetical protein
MPYEKVVISEALGANNDLGKPITFLGVMKRNADGMSLWTDNRREIVLAIGRTAPGGKFYIGEVRKNEIASIGHTIAEWKWVWGVPLEDISGYEDLVAEIKKDKEAEGSPKEEQ